MNVVTNLKVKQHIWINLIIHRVMISKANYRNNLGKSRCATTIKSNQKIKLWLLINSFLFNSILRNNNKTCNNLHKIDRVFIKCLNTKLIVIKKRCAKILLNYSCLQILTKCLIKIHRNNKICH